MNEAVAQRGEDMRRCEVRSGVVAQVDRVAEREAGAHAVVGIPGDEDEKGYSKGGDPAKVFATSLRRAAIKQQATGLKRDESCGLDDGGLFGESGKRKENGCCNLPAAWVAYSLRARLRTRC